MAVTKIDVVPESEVAITLEEAKRHLNIDADLTDEDDYVVQLIAVARDEAEAYTERALYETVTLELNNFDAVVLQAHRKAAVGSVKYLPAAGGDYTALDVEQHVKFFNKYGGDTCELRFKAGDNPLPELAESDAAVVVVINVTCPAALKEAMLLRIGNYHQFREDRPELSENRHATNLMRPFRSKWY